MRIKNSLKIYDPMPGFKNLPCVDGKEYSISDYETVKVLVIVFSCNHCPYVKAYEERMMSLQEDYLGKVELIAINSNDAANYPDDSFEEMVKRAKQMNFNFKYLRDADQAVASQFGATHTPQFFVFDPGRRLRYAGKMDDCWDNPSAVKQRYLRDALDSILSGTEIRTPETYSIGCTIKWTRPDNQ